MNKAEGKPAAVIGGALWIILESSLPLEKTA
ncbi:MAG: hypothetical protein ACI87C_001822 [Paraperlucidibaca sp.]|jgi:hypothetical protein